MPTFTPYTKHQLAYALDVLRDAIYLPIAPLEIHAWCTAEPLPFAQRTEGARRDFSVGDRWGSLFDCAWFHFTGVVPPQAAGQKVVLLLDVNGEMCVFDAAGVPQRGLTNAASTYDYSLGKPGKRVLPLFEPAAGGEAVDVWADAGCNDLFGELRENGVIKESSIAICLLPLRDLYYDFEVLLDFLNSLPEATPRYQQILVALTDVVHLLYNLFPSGGTPALESALPLIEQARACLAPHLARRGGDTPLSISAVGHAHMDLAWLWPLRETVRKGARTFSTAIANMELYPDYVFGASQPQYFFWMKQHYPALYEKIKQKVAEGRLEPQGVMWVEADTNISGGEALVRQILQGRRFFRQEFGVDVRYLWLPDVFGYNGNLPQLLKKAGVDIFATQKLSWSLINRFPHHSFHWQGIDGSTVLAHMFPEDTYNSPGAPRGVRRIEENYRDSGVSRHAIMVFGIGDGGGGHGEEHIERLQRLRNLEGLSPVRQEWAATFFERWRKDAARFSTWVGELYLERHEGTLTTNARNKYYNRKLELALRELEWSAVQASLLCGAPYPADFLRDTWREVLLYQFHDILPGSSIKRVYDESVARYQAMAQAIAERLAENNALLAQALPTQGMQAPVLIQNSLSWERQEWVCLPASEGQAARWALATVPPMGYTALDLAAQGAAAQDAAQFSGLAASPAGLENDLLKVTFGADGAITSLFDKRSRRELIPAGESANRFSVYTDFGDAWDFQMDYAEQTPRSLALAAAEAWLDGPRAVLQQTYRLGHSELVQEISLVLGSPRLDFVSRLRWREPQTMLRVRFPFDLHTDEATYEIQYGHLRRPTHRNTTWDLARDETAAHKWVDLSQRDYGVALLNDSKYGHKIKGHVIDLNLLRSVPYPGARVGVAPADPAEPNPIYTDQCDHRFTYALYPHASDPIEGGVPQAAYALNIPLRLARLTPSTAAALPARAALLQVDVPNVCVEVVKQAEDSPAIIVRLYELARRSTAAVLRFGFPVSAAAEVDLMEENPVPLDLQDGGLSLSFKPFEIKTIQLTRG